MPCLLVVQRPDRAVVDRAKRGYGGGQSRAGHDCSQGEPRSLPTAARQWTAQEGTPRPSGPSILIRLRHVMLWTPTDGAGAACRRYARALTCGLCGTALLIPDGHPQPVLLGHRPN